MLLLKILFKQKLHAIKTDCLHIKPFLAQIALLNDIQRKAKGYRLFSKGIVNNPLFTLERMDF